jgi:ABC-2 type transport system permease protein
VKPTVSGDDFALNFTEMSSPIQLLFGSFDLAFVIVYLLPLLIIAFSYNVFSLEKERGSLRLLASQPIGIHTWLLQKLGLRFFWLSVLLIVTMTAIVLIAGIDIMAQPLAYLSLVSLSLVYMLFWFVLAFLVNLWIGNSAKNAVSLIGLWVIFVLLVPSVLNQLGNTFYPMPSRTLMINEMRIKKTEVSKKQDEILDNFLRDHPEYALNDSTQSRGFYHRYMASQKLVKEELNPIVNRFEEQLQKQQILVGRLKWTSPALIMQESLNKLAGTSSADYESFRAQVVTFAENWREHLMPFLYNNQDFTVNDYANLPKFHMVRPANSPSAAIVPLLTISMLLLVFGFILSKKGYKRFNIINS